MFTLYVGGRLIDLGEDPAADLTYSLSDIRTPDKRQVNFSKTLSLPGTVRNNAAFGYIYDLHTENIFDEDLPNIGVNFNPKKLAPATLYKDGIQIFDGTLRLWKAVKRGEDVTYEVSLYGKLFDLFAQLGDKVLADLNFSDQDHALSWPNIQSNWAAASPLYRYPLIDWGKLVLDLTGKPAEMKIGAIGPCLYHKAILSRIFSDAGAQYSLNFDQSIYNKILVTPNRGDVVGKPTFFVARKTFDVAFETDIDNPETVFGGLPIVDVVDVSTLNLMSGPNYTRLRFPSAAETSIQVTLKFRVQIMPGADPGDGIGSIFFTTQKSGDPSEIIASTEFDVSQDTAGASLTLVTEIPRRAYALNEEFKVNASLPEGYALIVEAGSGFHLVSPNDTSEYPLNDGDIYNMNRALPKDIKQVDFVKDFIKLFNLYVTQAPDNPKLYIFTPGVEFYNTDKTQAKDWTGKIDISEEIPITPVAQLTAKEYLFTWKEDRDYFNTLYKELNREIYGQLKFVGDTDVVTNTEKIESIFAPAIMQRYVGSNCITPAIYKVDNGFKKPDSFLPRLLIWGGLKDAGHDIELQNASGVMVATINQYPYAGHIDDPITPTYDLNFGSTKTDLPTAPITTFTRYWLSQILDALDKDSKLIECKMLLKPEDIQSLDFAALIKVFNQYFRLNKIEGYNPFALQTCKVELIKKL